MEEFTTAEKKLNEMLAKKRALDKQIATIQVSIYALETAYLEETPYGNVVKGLKGEGGRGAGRTRKILDSERIFSSSAAGFGANITSQIQEEKIKSLKRRKEEVNAGGSARKKKDTAY